MRIFVAIILAISSASSVFADVVVDVVAAASSRPFDNNDWALRNGYHLKGQHADPNKCFCSGDANGWATLDIQLSDVTKVELLNRFDQAFAYRLEHTTVKVCQKGGSCEYCGTMPSTGVSQWGSVVCPGGPIRGDYIRLDRPNEALNFCDVNVYAKQMFEVPVYITGATSSRAFDNNDWALRNGYHLQGQAPSPLCFCSADHNGWAILDIPFSHVTRVELLNRKDASFAYRLGGSTVEICTKGGPCKACGTFPGVGVSEWSSTSCSGGPIGGNQIKLRRPNECLNFCEINVYAFHNDKAVCTDYNWACPGLTDAQFLEDNKDEIAASHKLKDQEFNCDNKFFQLRCPKACGKCDA